MAETPDNPAEVMTLAEVAEYLQLAEKTVLRMVQRGEIPAAKVASQWRFMRPIVRDWLVSQMQSAAPAASAVGAARPLLPMAEVLRPELMSLELKPGPKEAIFRQMIVPLLETGFAADTDRLLRSLVDRERLMTTAVGHGIAIPHPRRPIPGMFPEPAIALGLCPEGVDFDAIDDQKVHVLFLVCATRDQTHLQLMAKVSWFSRQDVLAELRACRTPEQVRRIALRADADG